MNIYLQGNSNLLWIFYRTFGLPLSPVGSAGAGSATAGTKYRNRWTFTKCTVLPWTLMLGGCVPIMIFFYISGLTFKLFLELRHRCVNNKGRLNWKLILIKCSMLDTASPRGTSSASLL